MSTLIIKKFLNYFLLILLVFSITNVMELSVYAKDKVVFSLSGDSIDKDRLFDVDLIVNGNTSIAAVNVSLSYNSDYIEFRNISSPDKTFDVEYKTNNNKVTAIILCPYGYNFNGKAKLLSFKFKSIKSGNSNINLSVSDAVDSTPNKLSIGSVYGTNITVNGDKITSKSIKNKSSGDNSVDSDIKSKSSKSVDVPKVNYADSDDNSSYTTTSPVEDDIIIGDENSYTAYIIGGLVVLLMVSIFGVAYKLGKNNGNEDKDDTDK